MKNIWIRSLLVLAAFVFCAVAPRADAEDLGAVKQRMAHRWAAVEGLKNRGVAGENNRGFLEARAALSGSENEIVAAENADRSTVYAALAREAGSTPDEVGRARARKIAQVSPPGVWLQDEGGRWYKK